MHGREAGGGMFVSSYVQLLFSCALWSHGGGMDLGAKQNGKTGSILWATVLLQEDSQEEL